MTFLVMMNSVSGDTCEEMVWVRIPVSHWQETSVDLGALYGKIISLVVTLASSQAGDS